MTTEVADVQSLEARHVLQTYRRSPITFIRGEGVRLYDSEGREYLTFFPASASPHWDMRIRRCRGQSPSRPKR